MLKLTLKIAAISLLHCLLLLVINYLSVLEWGNPHGLSMGITLYCLWVVLTLVGFGSVALFCLVRPTTAFVVTIVLIFLVTYILYPGIASPLYISMTFASVIFFLFHWLLTERQRKPYSN